MIHKIGSSIRYLSTSSKNSDPFWTHSRSMGIKIRQALTNEWAVRGIDRKDQFIRLTNLISYNTFSMTPAELKQIKGLDVSCSLRDHMNELELSLIQLAEVSTLDLIKHLNPQGFHQNYQVAGYGGEIAGVARRVFERKTGVCVLDYGKKKLS